jgi:hypothetical protein
VKLLQALLTMGAATNFDVAPYNPSLFGFFPANGHGVPRWPERQSYRDHQRQKAKRKNQRRAAL